MLHTPGTYSAFTAMAHHPRGEPPQFKEMNYLAANREAFEPHPSKP
jgi:hypothetical protein